MFFALFGAVGLVGVIGASAMTVMKGPVRSMHNVTQKTIAENNMIAAGKLALIAASSQPDDGDCDADTTIEPIPFESAGAGPKPVGGGYLPGIVAAAKQDPWGTGYGYCVWDHGTTIKNGTCAGDAGRLRGQFDENGVVVAILSAGPDRAFQTSCADAPGYVQRVAGSDDIILQYTYDEAGALAAGLWKIKGGSPNVAAINKNLEVTNSGGNVVFGVDATWDVNRPSVTLDYIKPLANPRVEVLSPLHINGALSATTLSGDGSALTALNATNLGSGTIPNARFPATLPAVSAANLTNLNASNLASGTVPVARLSGSYTGITGTGALNAGSITAGFGAINIGPDPLTAGAASFTGVTAGASTFSGTVGVAAPTAAGHATTRQYVDALVAGVTGANETDPQVGTLTNGRWCTTNGSIIDCTQTAPVLAETDPQVGTLTNGRWCTTNGTTVNCTTVAPVLTEADPKVGAVTSGRWCRGSGSQVICDQTAPSGGNVAWLDTLPASTNCTMPNNQCQAGAKTLLLSAAPMFNSSRKLVAVYSWGSSDSWQGDSGGHGHQASCSRQYGASGWGSCSCSCYSW